MVEWICRLVSSLPVVPGILSTVMSCIQGGIPIGTFWLGLFSNCIASHCTDCKYLSKHCGSSLQISMHVGRRQGGELGFKELGVS